MKRLIISLLCIVLSMSLSAQWTSHYAYHTLTDAVRAGELTYALYEGGNLLASDGTETFLYDKSTGLSDKSIALIDYSTTQRRLVAVYSNGNIDLIATSAGRASVVNIPTYKNNPDPELNLHSLTVQGDDALLATGEGVMWLNLRDATIRGYYHLGATQQARIVDGTLYAQLTDGTVRQCATSANLLDLNLWTTAAALPERTDKTQSHHLDATETAQLTAALGTFGPSRDLHYQMRYSDGKLLSASGFLDPYDRQHNSYLAMTYDGQRWSTLASDFSADPYPLPAARGDQYYFYRDVNDLIADPSDATHLFASTAGAGIFEYKGGKIVNRYGVDNSTLKSAAGAPNKTYVRTDGLAFDAEGNLWCVCNGVDSVLHIRKANGQWKRYYFPSLDRATRIERTLIDSRGYFWACSRRETDQHPGGLFGLKYGGKITSLTSYRNAFRSSFRNEDGTSYTFTAFCIAEDHDGQLWLGTDAGLFIITDPDEWFTDNFLAYQVKVPRNDGTNFADYLLSGLTITSIAVDAANRKWIGTSNNGIYLVSDDGLETIHHFTADNSPLPSDYIYSIAINHANGEVMISTTQGLVSYKGDATQASERLRKSDLHIFPNPLRPEHPRLVRIQGLTDGAEVKILTVGGQVVNRGTSLGGCYEWDATTLSGRPAASGVYYVAVATSDGKTAIAGTLVVMHE